MIIIVRGGGGGGGVTTQIRRLLVRIGGPEQQEHLPGEEFRVDIDGGVREDPLSLANDVEIFQMRMLPPSLFAIGGYYCRIIRGGALRRQRQLPN